MYLLHDCVAQPSVGKGIPAHADGIGLVSVKQILYVTLPLDVGAGKVTFVPDIEGL